MHLAVEQGKYYLLPVFLDVSRNEPIDLNATTYNNDMTPLRMAILHGPHEDSYRSLRTYSHRVEKAQERRGAARPRFFDMSVRNNNGDTALHLVNRWFSYPDATLDMLEYIGEICAT